MALTEKADNAQSVEINIANFNTVAGALTNTNTQTSEATYPQTRHIINTIQLDPRAMPAASCFIFPIKNAKIPQRDF